MSISNYCGSCGSHFSFFTTHKCSQPADYVALEAQFAETRAQMQAMEEVIEAARKQQEHFAKFGKERLTVHDVTAILMVNKALKALDRFREGIEPSSAALSLDCCKLRQ